MANQQILEVLDKHGLETLVRLIQDEIENVKDSVVLEYESSLNFPVTGKTNTLYIDTTNNKSYRWDDDNTKYYVVGSDYNDISLIDANF